MSSVIQINIYDYAQGRSFIGAGGRGGGARPPEIFFAMYGVYSFRVEKFRYIRFRPLKNFEIPEI